MGENFNIIYCKHNYGKFLKGEITFQICLAVNKIVMWQAVVVQQIRGVWLICVKSREAMKTLLTTHIKIEYRDVTLYTNTPFEIGRRNRDAERIVFREFPLWETNILICNYVKSMPQLTALTEEVFNSKARNNVPNGASSFTNGDRYMFVKKGFDPPIPEKVSIGDYTCRVWYARYHEMYNVRNVEQKHTEPLIPAWVTITHHPLITCMHSIVVLYQILIDAMYTWVP